ncbi:MAG: DUF192 domain-containing protein [Patescibacteria group bacterium]
MKKFLFISFVLAVITYFFVFKNNHCLNNQTKIYSINNKNYCLLTAKNQTEWERGLMFYKKPVNFDGMIFIFPDKEMRSFWNKNTYMDLEVYWMDGEKVVGKSFLPSMNKNKKAITVSSPKIVNKVIEIVQ